VEVQHRHQDIACKVMLSEPCDWRRKHTGGGMPAAHC
jgi:hypothetical protein